MSTKAIYVSNESDVAEAVRQAMKAAVEIGFGTVQSHYIATAASELAANLLIHAGGGVLTLLQLVEPSGIELMTIDGGPGIADIGIVGHLISAQLFKIDLAAYPTVKALGDTCFANPAFMDSHPLRQPGAPQI